MNQDFIRTLAGILNEKNTDDTDWKKLCDNADIGYNDITALKLIITLCLRTSLKGDETSKKILLGALSHYTPSQTALDDANCNVNNADITYDYSNATPDELLADDNKTIIPTANEIFPMRKTGNWTDYAKSVDQISAFLLAHADMPDAKTIKNIMKLSLFPAYAVKNHIDSKDDARNVCMRIIDIINTGMPFAMKPVPIQPGNKNRVIMSALNGGFTQEQFIKTVVWFNGLCPYCNETMMAGSHSKNSRTGDHIIPISAPVEEGYGETAYGNVIIACKQCNGEKDHHPLEVWLASKYKSKKMNKILNRINAFIDYTGYKRMSPDASMFAKNEIDSINRLPESLINDSIIKNAVNRINDYRNGKPAENLKPSAANGITNIEIHKAMTREVTACQDTVINANSEWMSPLISCIKKQVHTHPEFLNKQHDMLMMLKKNNHISSLVENITRNHVNNASIDGIISAVMNYSYKNINSGEGNKRIQSIAILQGGRCCKCCKSFDTIGSRIRTINGLTVLLCRKCSVMDNAYIENIDNWVNNTNRNMLLRIGWKQGNPSNDPEF